jgi:hypothetical protein
VELSPVHVLPIQYGVFVMVQKEYAEICQTCSVPVYRRDLKLPSNCPDKQFLNQGFENPRSIINVRLFPFNLDQPTPGALLVAGKVINL